MKDNAIIDAKAQVLRCEICGDEIPIPLGDTEWVVAVMKAFAKAHAGTRKHESKRTLFSTPKGKQK